MSIRTLIEVNHDYIAEALSLPPTDLANLLRYAILHSGDIGTNSRDRLGMVGIKIIGERHHSEQFSVPAHSFKIQI